ncbi:very short patch repair endonuclease [Micromonospora echinospora]|uniref:very short patch repair endonuclease n=1 Tax=Micromonospora echinospora TaxID=1877 RepID=UPI0034213F2A
MLLSFCAAPGHASILPHAWRVAVDGVMVGTMSEKDSAQGSPEAAGLPYPRAMDEGRSRNMRANRRSGTKPEVLLRSQLHRLGYRYRKDHRLDLPTGARVRPDIVFTRRKVAIFVDGCFWHACPQHGREPTRNEWYWSPKLRRNVERDRLADQALVDAGWQVVRIWEHEDLRSAVARVRAAVEHAFDDATNV